MILEQESTLLSSGEEDVRQYMQEIRQYPRLTPEEERQLAIGCAQGDTDAIRRMVNSNLWLVVSVAREYAGRGVPLLDLVQEGSIGLLTAAKKFDYTLELRFSTYASQWIRQGINRCILNHSGLVHLPRRTAEQVRKLLALKIALQQNGQEPTLQELAVHSGIPEDRVELLLNHLPDVCSLDAPVQDGDMGKLYGLLEDMHSPQPHEEFVREALKESLDTLLAQLSDRQRQVLRLRFGMEDGICYSLEWISQALGVSKERVRQIENQAMAKLKKMGAGLGLEDFLNE